MPTAEWMKQYEAVREILDADVKLERYFTEKVIGRKEVDILDLGPVQFPTGKIVVCDPLVTLDDAVPYLQTIPAGSYTLKLCVVPSKEYGDRYACAKLEVSGRETVRYELAVTGKERLEGEFKEGDYFGFGVDAGMACIADFATKEAYLAFLEEKTKQDSDFDLYGDLLEELLKKNAAEHPKYQSEWGDWLKWEVPGANAEVALFASGWGDGYYPTYFGYDSEGKVSGIYIQFIDIERTYTEENEA